MPKSAVKEGHRDRITVDSINIGTKFEDCLQAAVDYQGTLFDLSSPLSTPPSSTPSSPLSTPPQSRPASPGPPAESVTAPPPKPTKSTNTPHVFHDGKLLPGQFLTPLRQGPTMPRLIPSNGHTRSTRPLNSAKNAAAHLKMVSNLRGTFPGASPPALLVVHVRLP